MVHAAAADWVSFGVTFSGNDPVVKNQSLALFGCRKSEFVSEWSSLFGIPLPTATREGIPGSGENLWPTRAATGMHETCRHPQTAGVHGPDPLKALFLTVGIASNDIRDRGKQTDTLRAQLFKSSGLSKSLVELVSRRVLYCHVVWEAEWWR
jgi:hypothetical protein